MMSINFRGMVKVMDVIGENLKNIRLSLKLTRSEFAKDVIDSSYLAHIEKNKNEIRAIDLVEILEQNNISLMEFLSSFGEVKEKNRIYEEKASKAFFVGDVDTLTDMLENFAYPGLIIRQVVSLMRDKLTNHEASFPKKFKTMIKRFLFSVDCWNNDCLWIIANSLEIFAPDEIYSIIILILRNYTDFEDYTDRKIKLLAEIVTNFLELYANSKVSSWKIKHAFSYIEKMPSRPIIFYEKARVAYLKAENCYNKEKSTMIGKILDYIH